MEQEIKLFLMQIVWGEVAQLVVRLVNAEGIPFAPRSEGISLGALSATLLNMFRRQMGSIPWAGAFQALAEVRGEWSGSCFVKGKAGRKLETNWKYMEVGRKDRKFEGERLI